MNLVYQEVDHSLTLNAVGRVHKLHSTSGVKTLHTHLVYDSWLLNRKLEIVQVLDVSCQQSEGLN